VATKEKSSKLFLLFLWEKKIKTMCEIGAASGNLRKQHICSLMRPVGVPGKDQASPTRRGFIPTEDIKAEC
jgi:hypothetical protein